MTEFTAAARPPEVPLARTAGTRLNPRYMPARRAYVVQLGGKQLGLVADYPGPAGETLVCWRITRSADGSDAEWKARSAHASAHLGNADVGAPSPKALLEAMSVEHLVPESTLTSCPALGGAGTQAEYRHTCRSLGVTPNWEHAESNQLEESEAYSMR